MSEITKENIHVDLNHQKLEEVLAKALEAEQFISWYDHETLLIGDNYYKLQTNFRDAFDIEQFKARYIDYLTTFDYIVGDIASEKLRLRGFYDESRSQVHEDQWITRLDDYLIEYCNFGAPYFVLERVEKLDEIPIRKQDREHDKRRKNRQNSRRRRSRRRFSQKRQSSSTHHPFKKEPRNIPEGDMLKKEPTKAPKSKAPKQRFKIRNTTEK
ncbi:YutD family protein [Allofustis seminis]|uniref:YutD family protein n=1 Tax=Allofustis seminis TaxID=166939 RepID=UPI0003687851|nr:YutD family protein [Allofustis seminis]